MEKQTYHQPTERYEPCPICGVPLVPSLENVIYGTTEWDGHTYKPNCEHFKYLRISIG